MEMTDCPSVPRHPKEYLHTGSRMLMVPVRIHWRYKDKSGVTKAEVIAMPDEEKGCFDISEYWWSESNGACDCNRTAYCKLSPKKYPALYHLKGQMYDDGSGPCEKTDTRCGHDICIQQLESLDPLVPSLILDEELADETPPQPKATPMNPDDTIRPEHNRPPELMPPTPAINQALAAALNATAEPTDEQNRLELAMMEAETFDSLVAFTNACACGLLQGVALSYDKGAPQVVLLIRKKTGVEALPFTGLNLVDAFIQAGLEVHTQLAYLGTKSDKVKDYLAWYRKRKELRQGQRIIIPGKN